MIDLPILSVQGEADIQALAKILKNLADYWDAANYDPEWDYMEDAEKIAATVFAAGWRPRTLQ